MSINIVVPQLGESVVEARIARWLKHEGEPVAAGEPVVELETEKIDLEVGAEHAGVLTKIARQEGEDVKVGEVLAVVEPGSAPADARATPAADSGVTADPEPPDATATPAAAKERATPTARRVAEAHDVKLSAVAGSGEAGRITKRDVVERLAPAPNATPTAKPPEKPATAAKPAPASPRPAGTRAEERVRMSKRRLTIARNLVEAQRTAAMLTTFNEVDMSAVMALRERRKQAFKERYGVNLGIASFFVKASVGALKAFPRLNAEIQGEEMVLKHYCDIGIAVGAPQGLVVPVLRNAEHMTFAESSWGFASSPPRPRTAR